MLKHDNYGQDMKTWKEVRTFEQRLTRLLWKLKKQPGATLPAEFIEGAIEALKWAQGHTKAIEDFAKDQEAILDEKWRGK